MFFEQVQRSFISSVEKLEPQTNVLMMKAYELAELEHQGQKRKQHKGRAEEDLDPYLIHPLRVSLILMNDLHLCDQTALTAALLHDVVEDGNSRPQISDIESKFGPRIAETVAFLTKPENVTDAGDQNLKEYHDSFFSSPLHVRLVKLADRLDNLRESLLVDRPKFQQRYLKETRTVYLPLAKQTSFFFFDNLNRLCQKLESLLN